MDREKRRRETEKRNEGFGDLGLRTERQMRVKRTLTAVKVQTIFLKYPLASGIIAPKETEPLSQNFSNGRLLQSFLPGISETPPRRRCISLCVFYLTIVLF